MLESNRNPSNDKRFKYNLSPWLTVTVEASSGKEAEHKLFKFGASSVLRALQDKGDKDHAKKEEQRPKADA